MPQYSPWTLWEMGAGINQDKLTHAQHIHMVNLAKQAAQAVPIPKADALRLCSDICHERAGHWFSPAAWRCAICVKLAREGVPLRVITGHPGYNGCPAVNQRYLMEQRKALASA